MMATYPPYLLLWPIDKSVMEYPICFGHWTSLCKEKELVTIGRSLYLVLNKIEPRGSKESDSEMSGIVARLTRDVVPVANDVSSYIRNLDHWRPRDILVGTYAVVIHVPTKACNVLRFPMIRLDVWR